MNVAGAEGAGGGSGETDDSIVGEDNESDERLGGGTRDVHSNRSAADGPGPGSASRSGAGGAVAPGGAVVDGAQEDAMANGSASASGAARRVAAGVGVAVGGTSGGCEVADGTGCGGALAIGSGGGRDVARGIGGAALPVFRTRSAVWRALRLRGDRRIAGRGFFRLVAIGRAARRAERPPDGGEHCQHAVCRPGQQSNTLPLYVGVGLTTWTTLYVGVGLTTWTTTASDARTQPLRRRLSRGAQSRVTTHGSR